MDFRGGWGKTGLQVDLGWLGTVITWRGAIVIVRGGGGDTYDLQYTTGVGMQHDFSGGKQNLTIAIVPQAEVGGLV